MENWIKEWFRKFYYVIEYLSLSLPPSLRLQNTISYHIHLVEWIETHVTIAGRLCIPGTENEYCGLNNPFLDGPAR